MKAQFAMQNRETTPTPALVLKINWPPVVLSNSEEVTDPSNSVGEISINIASGNDKEIVQLPTDIDKDVDNEIYKAIDMEIETIDENHANIVSEDHDSFYKNNLGIRFVGDNVNVRTSPRYMGKGRETKQYDIFNIIAVENKVPFEESADGKSVIQQIPVQFAVKQLCNFVPDRNDNFALRDDFKHLIGNTLKKCQLLNG